MLAAPPLLSSKKRLGPQKSVMRKIQNLTLNGGQFAFDVVFYSILMSLFVEPFDIFIANREDSA